MPRRAHPVLPIAPPCCRAPRFREPREARRLPCAWPKTSSNTASRLLPRSGMRGRPSPVIAQASNRRASRPARGPVCPTHADPTVTVLSFTLRKTSSSSNACGLSESTALPITSRLFDRHGRSCRDRNADNALQPVVPAQNGSHRHRVREVGERKGLEGGRNTDIRVKRVQRGGAGRRRRLLETRLVAVMLEGLAKA
jgi:hypothetical protein